MKIAKRIIFNLLFSNGNFYLSRNYNLQKVGDLDWIKKNFHFVTISFSFSFSFLIFFYFYFRIDKPIIVLSLPIRKSYPLHIFTPKFNL